MELLPLEIINYIFNFLNIDINNDKELKQLSNCSICSGLFINKDKRWYCSSQCHSQLLLML